MSLASKTHPHASFEKDLGRRNRERKIAVPKNEIPWNRDPQWNPGLASEMIFAEELNFKGGGRVRPEGGLFEVTFSVGQIGLDLDLDGGRLFPATRLASIGARLMAFGRFEEIRFAWQDVQRVESMRGWAPWDGGVRFKLSGGKTFVFFSLLGETLKSILDCAEARGVTVDRKQSQGPS